MDKPNPEDLEALIEIFNKSDWTEVSLRVHDTELFLSRDAGSAGLARAGSMNNPPEAGGVPSVASAVEGGSGTGAIPVAPADVGSAAAPDGLTVVTAPNLGTFYRSPKPGAPPYVEIGQKVTPDTEVCLIEVMKLFTPVVAGVYGVVREVCVEDGQMVEFEQPLFYLEPRES